MTRELMSLFQELKRRNVFRVGAAYLLASWVLLQAADFVLDAISAPNWILQVFILAAAIGFFAVLVFSWVFEMTPEGLKREKDIDRTQSITPQTGRKLDRVIIAFLAVAVVVLLVDRFWDEAEGTGSDAGGRFAADQTGSRAERAPTQDESANPTVGGRLAADPEPGGKSIAVLPFLALSDGADDGYFADGLTEEILNSLAQLPELLVTSRTSAFHFKGKDIPLTEIAATLGVANIVEGSVRRSGERLRVTAQLIRAEDGFHLWSENYDSTSEDTIAVQEDIALKIATAMDVVMDDTKREAMRQAGLRDVEAFIAFQKGNEFYEKAHGDADQINLLRKANRYYESVMQKAPAYPPSYQQHSDLYVHLLINNATGQPMPGVTREEIDAALGLAVADFEAARQYARTPEERNNLELDLLYLSSDWRGSPARLEQFFGERGCDQPAWVQNTALTFGMADRLTVRLNEFRLCDPLSPSNWLNESRSTLWAGDAAGAATIAREGLEVTPSVWLASGLVRALVVQGAYEEAGQVIDTRMSSSVDALLNRILVAAVQGDAESTARLFAEYEEHPLASMFYEVIYHAWTGNREEANRLASIIDAQPLGVMALTNILMWCTCGAPWDLAATPILAQRMDEAALTWPPVSPIKFPLKNW